KPSRQVAAQPQATAQPLQARLALKRLFDRLREYKLRLNPAKCTFGARSRKLLGFVVSERVIEVDPDKVKAIKELPPPSTVPEVGGFLGRLNYIAHFIANMTDKCQPLFRLLHKNAVMEWDHECQKASTPSRPT
ncbi:hypothetical protein CRG98_008428, partial [Punica granatum]